MARHLGVSQQYASIRADRFRHADFSGLGGTEFDVCPAIGMGPSKKQGEDFSRGSRPNSLVGRS